jgi:hypothetical protein
VGLALLGINPHAVAAFADGVNAIAGR